MPRKAMDAEGCRNSRGVGWRVLAGVGGPVSRVRYQLHRLAQDEHDALPGDGLRRADEHPGERHVEQRQAADHDGGREDGHGGACCRGRVQVQMQAVAGTGAGCGRCRRRLWQSRVGPAAKTCRAPLAPAWVRRAQPQRLLLPASRHHGEAQHPPSERASCGHRATPRRAAVCRAQEPCSAQRSRCRRRLSGPRPRVWRLCAHRACTAHRGGACNGDTEGEPSYRSVSACACSAVAHTDGPQTGTTTS
jgi:hypothetical protein